MKWLLVFIMVGIGAVPAAHAQIPDPGQSSVSPWDTYGQAFVIPGASTSGDVVTVTVLDNLGTPVVGVTVTIDVSNCNNLCIDTPNGLSGTTDGSGVVTLNPRVGGCETCNVRVYAGGILLRTFTQVTSPDWDGSWANGSVSSEDSMYFYANYPSPPYPLATCVDYDNNGTVDLINAAIFNAAYGDANTVLCPRGPNPTQSSVSPWDTFGQAFVIPGATTAGDVVTVTVLDNTGTPCPGVAVTIDLSSCNNLCIDTPDGLSGTTDGSGVVTLNPRVGGCEACNVEVWAGGVLLRTYTQVTSSDWDGMWADGRVRTEDSLYFYANYPSPPAPYVACVDYNSDGSVDLNDLSLFGGGYGDSNTVTCPYPVCDITPTSIDYGSVSIGGWKDASFTVKNTGGSTLSGAVSESCDHYDIISGGGAFGLSSGESLIVTVRFEPTAEGTQNCDVNLGQLLCSTVPLTGVGTANPLISSIVDVGNDQGRQVRITFMRSSRDTVGSATPIVQYEAYRRIDPLPSAPLEDPDVGTPSEEDRIRRAREAGMRSDASVLLAGWDYAGAVPANADQIYNLIAPTLADSTISNGMYWSVFFIRATTATVGVYFDSPVDSGYSLDNLAPSVPASFSIAYNTGSGNQLDWDPSPDEDFQYFKVYRSTDPNFTPAPSDLVQATIDDSWLDTVSEGWRYSYKITAVDFSGNESDPASAGTATSVGEQPAMPAAYALYQNRPNPFNPTTSIRFDVPAGGGDVKISVYDVKGRLVRTLVDGRQTAGEKSVTWNAQDSAGRKVASGVYFCRLTAPGVDVTQKMVLLE